MKITISGASGLIGRRLMKSLAADGHSLNVLSRHAGTNMPVGVKLFVWDPPKGEPPADSLRDSDAVIHLAGEPVAQRWSAVAKQRIRDSRVIGTRNLVQALARLARKPEVLICASARLMRACAMAKAPSPARARSSKKSSMRWSGFAAGISSTPISAPPRLAAFIRRWQPCREEPPEISIHRGAFAPGPKQVGIPKFPFRVFLSDKTRLFTGTFTMGCPIAMRNSVPSMPRSAKQSSSV